MTGSKLKFAIFAVLFTALFALSYGAYIMLTKTPLQMYFVYGMLSVAIFLASFRFGKEIYFLLLIPIFFISPVFSGALFNFSYTNADGNNFLRVHFVTICFAIIFLLEFIYMLLTRGIKLDTVFVSGVLVMVSFFAITVIKRGTGGLGILLETHVGPILFFLFFYSCKGIDMKKLRFYVRIFLAIVFICIFLGAIEFAFKYNPFDSFFNELHTTRVVSNVDEYRINVLQGNIPLSMLFLLGGIWTHMLVKNTFQKYVMLSLITIGVLMTGTRTFFIMMLLLFFYNADYSGDIKQLLRRLFIPMVVVVIVLAALMFTPIGGTIIQRFVDDGSSGNARLILIDYFFKHLTGPMLYGLGGFSDAVIIKDSIGNAIISEIPWIVMYFDLGPLFFLYLFFIFKVFQKCKNKFFIILLLAAFTPFNSIGIKSTNNYCFFMIAVYSMLAERSKNEKLAIDLTFVSPLAVVKANILPVLTGIIVCASMCFGVYYAVERFVPKSYTSCSLMHVWHNPKDIAGYELLHDEPYSYLTYNSKLAKETIVIMESDYLIKASLDIIRNNYGMVIEGINPGALNFETMFNSPTISVSYTSNDANESRAVVRAVSDFMRIETDILLGSEAVVMIGSPDVIEAVPESARVGFFSSFLFAALLLILTNFTKFINNFKEDVKIYG